MNPICDLSIRLSPQQEMICRLLSSQADAPYRVSAAVVIEGPFDDQRAAAAIVRVLSRHEILRTVFLEAAGSQSRVPSIQDASFELDAGRAIDSSVDERPSAIRQALERYARDPVDISTAPALRATLHHLGVNAHVLVLTISAMCADAGSAFILLEEIAAEYESPRQIEALQYSGVASWLAESLDLEETRLGREYWMELIRQGWSRVAPSLYSHTERSGFDPDWVSVSLASDWPVRVRHLIGPNPTLAGILLTAWGITVARLSDEKSIVAGVTVSGRDREELRRVAGPLDRRVPLRLEFGKEAKFADLCRATDHSLSEAQKWQEFFDPCAMQDWDELGDFGGCGVGFEFYELPAGAQIAGSKWYLADLFAVVDRCAAALTCLVSQDSMILRVQYDSSVYQREKAQRFADCLAALLDSVAQEPQLSVSELPLMADSVRKEILDLSRGPLEPLVGLNIIELFEQQASLRPAAVALCFEEHQITYGELNSRANHNARWLRSLAVSDEQRVAICLDRSPDMVIAILAVWKAGGAYVPLDPEYPLERLQSQLADSGARVLFEQKHLCELIPLEAEIRRFIDDCPPDHRLSSENLGIAMHPESLAYVMYTSGSTGVPKGVAVTHRGVANLARFLIRSFDSHTGRVLQFASWGFDASVWELLMALTSGGTLQLTGAYRRIPGPDLADLIESTGITIATLPPSALVNLPERQYPELKMLIAAGEQCMEGLVNRWSGGRRFVNAYGPTETTVCATMAECAPGGGKPHIGRAIANTRVYVVDAQHNLVPAEIEAELCVSGNGLARGYLGNAALTAKQFVPDPFSERYGERMYRTGDRARLLPNGSIEFIGRLDEQVKIRGVRIELGEVHSALCMHSSVREAAVIVRPGEFGAARILAYAVCDGESTELDLIQYLSDVLPRHMMPAAVVILPTLPLNPHGKIDRDALPDPALRVGDSETDFVPLRTYKEELLAGIWCEMLGLARVGIHDNFFALGGHSIAAVQLVSRVRELFDIEVPVRLFFEAPTIAGLSHAVETTLDSSVLSRGPILPVEREGDLLLSYGQQEMWLLHQLDPQNPAYNLPLLIRLGGVLNIDGLRSSLDQLVDRHESLRTIYHLSGDGPVQRVLPASAASFEIVDLRTNANAEAHSRAFLDREARVPIDLASGPVVRAFLIRLTEEEQLLLLLTHHIVFDAWSVRVLIRELRVFYEAFVSGEDPDIPPLPIQYRDYAAWQRGWMSGAVLEAHLKFWKDHLSGHPGVLNLPVDKLNSEKKASEGGSEPIKISKELTDRLRALAVKERATLFMTVLAAFKLLLYRHCSDDDIVVGTPIVNRDRIETEGLIGLLMNTLAIRTKLSSEMTFAELIAGVRESCLGAFSHQDLPFELLVQSLRPDRQLASSPIFQVLFALQAIGINEKPVEGLNFEFTTGETGTAKYSLSLELVESAGGMDGSLMYDKALFESETIRRMAVRFVSLLERAVSEPLTVLRRFEILTPAERSQVLVEWNGQRCVEGRELGVHQAFECQAAATPERPAIVFNSGTLSYGEVNGKANALAAELRERGISENGFVPVLMSNSFELIISYLAVMKCGAAFVPLAPDWPRERLVIMIQETGAPLVLARPDTVHLAEAIGASWILVNEQSLRSDEPDPKLSLDSGRRIYAMYTSGSTGRPKGAINLHLGIMNRLLDMNKRLNGRQDDVVLHVSPHIFDHSIWQLFWPLINGACVVLPLPEARLDFMSIVSLIREERVTVTGFVPSLLALFLDYLESEPSQGEHLATLRWVLIGGEPLIAANAERLKRIVPGVRLLHTYGPTEAAISVLTYDLPNEFTDPIPVGRPIENTWVLILDENLNPVPPGVPGELYLGGDSLGEGYVNNEEATSAAFVRNPFPEVVSARLYKTGDYGRRLSDGNVILHGRRDNQVKIFGVRIELEEVEAALREHPGVSDVAVVCREDGIETKTLIAYVVTPDGHPCSASDLRSFLRGRLPAYMTPAVFVTLGALPLNASGKLDRHLLPDPGIPSTTGQDDDNPPTDHIEVQVLSLWEEVSGVRQIGMDDGFFELGGHSLSAVRLVAKIQQHFGVAIPVSLLFRGGTVREMAEEIRRKSPVAAWTPLVAVQPAGSRPPLFFVHPIGGSVACYFELARALGADQPFYALQAPRLDEIGEAGDVHNSIEAMAVEYLAEVRRIQPAGPFHVGGWSMGGVIALEMAHQLMLAGEKMALLAIFDTLAPEPREAIADPDGTILWALARERAVSTRRETPVRFEELESIDEPDQLEFLLEHLRKARFLAPETDLEMIKRYVAGFRARTSVVGRYSPPMYDGRVTLFRAAQLDPDLVKAGLLNPEGLTPTYGWERISTEPPLVLEIPGTHATISQRPNVNVLAEVLRSCISDRKPTLAATS